MNQRSIKHKVFGIGLNKTGTTTLGLCGEILGYRYTGCDRELLEDVVSRNDFSRVKEKVSEYDFFEDWPWPLIYKELDQMYPGSKFVLTVRKNEEVWLNSLKKHSMRTHPARHFRKLAYGYSFPHRHGNEHMEFYKRHNDGVRSYFRGREKDFIELCWEHGHGWDELCAFLGKDIPDIPFPHANIGSEKRTSKKILLINRVLSYLDI